MDWSQRSSDFADQDRGGFAGRMEILDGPTGRRRWPDDVKARIVRESFETDTSIAAVARRHRISPQQLTDWRRLARDGRLILPWDEEAAGFVPLVMADDEPAIEPELQGTRERSETVEIAVGDLVVRFPAETAPTRIAALVVALRTAS